VDIQSIIEMLGGNKTLRYRKRLDKRHPEVFNTLAQTAEDILKKYDSMSQNELTEYIRSEMDRPATDALIGLASALEAISQGQMASRACGPTPMNVLCAFAYWLYMNPQIEAQFRSSDLFQELCDSGLEGFEWSDNFPEDEVPNPMIFGGNSDEPTPGNYL
jgi:hypothetical protein